MIKPAWEKSLSAEAEVAGIQSNLLASLEKKRKEKKKRKREKEREKIDE